MTSDGPAAPRDLSAQQARTVIRQLAEADRYAILDHARIRQIERGISDVEIKRCLVHGIVEEGPFVNPHGNWQATLTRASAGEELHVAVAIEWEIRALVVTVFSRRRRR